MCVDIFSKKWTILGGWHFCHIAQPRKCYRLWASHHGCWCGCWLHSSCSLSGHFGWSLQGWQAGEPGESGQWENCACPVGTYGHRWSGFLQQDTYKGWDTCDAVVHSNVLWVKGLVVEKKRLKQLKWLHSLKVSGSLAFFWHATLSQKRKPMKPYT